eukprot:TRINITY_DN8453_c0_g1_i1.p1 TRINITY_DN8453_c0_g1~~TRINITY_DN8453_c0_g1_i1.p1  ORF type:complete len:666 (+),score=239.34 TRINITY_DN8453_c0_g1_i1:212-1999(+)
MPPVHEVAGSFGAPPPHKVFDELDMYGYFWNDKNVAALLERFLTHDSPQYVAQHAPEFLFLVKQWRNRALLRGETARQMLTLHVVLGADKELGALWEEMGEVGVLTEAAYRAILRGCLLTKDVEKAHEYLAKMNRAGIERSYAVEEIVAALYAEVGEFELLEGLLGTSRSGLAVLTPDVLELLARVAIDNMMIGRALGYLSEAFARGVVVFQRDGKKSETLGALWQTFIQLETPDHVRQALDILKIMLGRHAPQQLTPPPTEGEVNIHARYVAPYDALMKSSVQLGMFEEAMAVFELVEASARAHLHPDSALGCIALATQAIAGGEGTAEHSNAVVRSIHHIHRGAATPAFVTLLHLQMALESSWETQDIQSAIVQYCPNFEERLLYYLPGFQDFRLGHRAVGGRAGAAALLRAYESVVVPDPSYLMAASGAFTAEATRWPATTHAVVPFSVLSSLQTTGDELREAAAAANDEELREGNPADGALRTLGAFLSTHTRGDETVAAHDMMSVLGIFEQRVVSSLHGDTQSFDVFYEEDKLMAVVAGLAAAAPAAAFELRTASPDSGARYAHLLSALPDALTKRIRVASSAAAPAVDE